MGQGVLALGIPYGWELVLGPLIELMHFASRIPAIGRGLGQSFGSFRRGMKEPAATRLAGGGLQV